MYNKSMGYIIEKMRGDSLTPLGTDLDIPLYSLEDFPTYAHMVPLLEKLVDSANKGRMYKGKWLKGRRDGVYYYPTKEGFYSYALSFVEYHNRYIDRSSPYNDGFSVSLYLLRVLSNANADIDPDVVYRSSYSLYLFNSDKTDKIYRDYTENAPGYPVTEKTTFEEKKRLVTKYALDKFGIRDVSFDTH